MLSNYSSLDIDFHSQLHNTQLQIRVNFRTAEESRIKSKAKGCPLVLLYFLLVKHSSYISHIATSTCEFYGTQTYLYEKKAFCDLLHNVATSQSRFRALIYVWTPVSFFLSSKHSWVLFSFGTQSFHKVNSFAEVFKWHMNVASLKIVTFLVSSFLFLWVTH